MPGPGEWLGNDKNWLDPDWSLNATTKRLEQLKSAKEKGSEIKFIIERTSDLIERAKKERDNRFRYERLLNAANALLGSGDLILLSQKKPTLPMRERDYWNMTGTTLMVCFSRVRQAEFFAPMSREKKADEYVKMARTLHRQAGDAYGAHNYHKAMLLAQSAESIVFALESLAQAAIPMPKPPLFK